MMMRGKKYGDQNGKNPAAPDAAESRRDKRRARGATTPADWGSADAAKLLKLVEVVTHDGGAIRFGYTRDMGAYAIGFYEDGECQTEYVKPSEDLDEWITGAIQDYE